MKRQDLIKEISKKQRFAKGVLFSFTTKELENIYNSLNNEKKLIKEKTTRTRKDYYAEKIELYNKAKKINKNVKWTDKIKVMKDIINEYNNMQELKTKLKDYNKKIKENILKNKRIILRVEDKYITINRSNYMQITEAIDNYIINPAIKKENLDDYEQLLIQKINGSSGAIELSFSDIISSNDSDGAFFPYINKSKYDLEYCSIYRTVNKYNYKNSCFINVLIQAGISPDKINEMKHILINEYIPKNKLNEICQMLDISINLKFREKTGRKDIRITKYNKAIKNIINVGLIEKHYFINNNNEFKLIETLLKNGEFQKIDLSDPYIFETLFYNEIEAKDNLKITNMAIKKHNHLCNNEVEYDNIFYADFESTTDGNIHKSYMVCCIDKNNISKKFFNKNHTKDFLNYITLSKQSTKNNKLVLIYFHNLGYDYQFFIKDIIVTSIIKNGSMVKEVKAIYNKTKLIFRDSYALIPKKLDDFNKMFGLDIKKGEIPHSLFNNKNMFENNGFIDVNDYSGEVDKKYITYNKIDLFNIAGDYCLNDCIVLKKGLEIYKKQLEEIINNNLSNEYKEFKIKNIIDKCISTPSLVLTIMKSNIENLKDIHAIGLNIQKFLQKFIIGGKCMLKQNKKQYKTGLISSLDANSLYPSAFIRLKELGGFLKGSPKIITDDKKNMDFLNSVDGYFIKIKITKVNKHLDFPILSLLKNGIRNFTNELENEILYVDKFTLEDAIKYQDIQYEILEGYYYNEGRNNNICNLVEELYKKRLQLKKDKNPLEEIYKLLLNSLYGKFIENSKNKETQINIIRGENKKNNFIDKKYNQIKEFYNIGNDNQNNEVYLFKTKKSIMKHFNYSHIGAEILSMSKRIMNEVFHIANLNNIEVFYQDTDSMKLYNKDVNLLSTEYYKFYGKNLLGNNLGQFKDEYEKNGVCNSNIFIGVGKKFYLSNYLKYNSPKDQYKISSKGIPIELILKYKFYNNNPENDHFDVIKVFNELYDGKKINFKNDNIKVMFKHNKDLTISMNNDFNRTIQFT